MNFIRVYDRKAAITGALENVELESCGVLGGVGKGLKSLEVRTQPAKQKSRQLGDFTKPVAEPLVYVRATKKETP